MITLAQLAEAAHGDLVPYWPVPLPRVELTGVHVSELEDPTVFLDGGELLLTVGMQLAGLDAPARAEAARAYVARLVEGRVAALGLGLGSGHSMVPDELRAACIEAGLPLLTVPRESPFLAVSRAYWELVRRGGEAELTALLGLQVALTRAAAKDDAEPAIVRELAHALGTWVAYLPEGDGPASCTPAGGSGELPPGLLDELRREAAALQTGGRGATATVHLASGPASLYPVSDGYGPVAYLAVGRGGQLAPAERHLFLTASTLLAHRAAALRHADEERSRSDGMLVALVLAGHDDAARLLAPQMHTALPETVYLVVLDASPGRGDQALPANALGFELGGLIYMLLPTETPRPPLPAGLRGAWGGPVPLRRVREVVGQVADAAGQAPPGRVVRVGHGLELPGDEWAAALAGAGGELLPTVRAYLRNRGQWEATARDLAVHRNSVRHRISRASELLGVDLDDPDVAAHLWLALRTG
ncbi:Fis family transcriptional regulator [Sinomonas cellulolyticus]|uniref:Helix-turn-helix domain-containing protein n=1 Tax=Sinomonas cellulolyticus TaxID=2801916 RepID=A0ABS1K6S5_9MICC|nr:MULTISPECIES: PucR family transcriptional regulator [Sinomonas]MBL0707389.1 helix-turn-helix domain-containing protein [Sinomonas cellulolyticus]GHG51006.1 Fis family transcriptional regulator [Sinomonas sp. KCTC 49339]